MTAATATGADLDANGLRRRAVAGVPEVDVRPVEEEKAKTAKTVCVCISSEEREWRDLGGRLLEIAMLMVVGGAAGWRIRYREHTRTDSVYGMCLLHPDVADWEVGHCYVG